MKNKLQILLEDRSSGSYEEWEKELIKQLAIIFQVPVHLFAKTYEKESQCKT